MESTYPSCLACFNRFNLTTRIPLLIPDCGHTICSICVNNQLISCNNESTFTCPQDKLPVVSVKLELSSFPKNFSLMKQIERLQETGLKEEAGARNLDSARGPRTSWGLDGNSSLMNSTENKPKNIFNMSEEPIEKFLSCPTPNLFSSFADNEVCPEHKKKYEILCLDHGVKLCTYCAIFGVHKSHSLQDFENAREIAANKLEDLKKLQNEVLFQIPKCPITSIPCSIEDLTGILKSKTKIMRQLVDSTVKDILNRLQVSRKEALKHIDRVSSLLFSSLQQGQNLKISETTNSAEKWGKRVEELLGSPDKIFQVLNQSANSNSKKEDHVNLEKSGRRLLGRLEGLSKFPFSEISNAVDEFGVEISSKHENLISSLNSLFILKGPQHKALQRQLKSETSPSNNSSKGFSFSRASRGSSSLNKSNSIRDIQDLNEFRKFKEKNRRGEDNLLFVFSNQELTMTRQEFSSGKKEKPPIQVLIHKKFNKSRAVSPITTQENQSASTSRSNLKKSKSERQFINHQINKGTKHDAKASKQKVHVKAIPEKFASTIESLDNNELECLDLTNANLSDGQLHRILPSIRRSHLLSIKLVKNQITDEGASSLIKTLTLNSSVHTLNLTWNSLTEDFFDCLFEFAKMNKILKNIYLNQNSIAPNKVKEKIARLKKLGINVFL